MFSRAPTSNISNIRNPHKKFSGSEYKKTTSKFNFGIVNIIPDSSLICSQESSDKYKKEDINIGRNEKENNNKNITDEIIQESIQWAEEGMDDWNDSLKIIDEYK